MIAMNRAGWIAPMAAGMTAVGTLVICLVAAQQICAQDPAEKSYKVMAVDGQYQEPPGLEGLSRDQIRNALAKKQQIRKTQDQMEAIAHGEQSISGQEAAFDQWFVGKVFAEMTQTHHQALSSMGDMRQDFFRNYLLDAPASNVRNRLVDLTFQTMRTIASEDYHPAARVNAVLIIGRLNTSEGQRGGAAPVPYAAAFDYLSQQLGDAAAPDYLEVPALTGLQRHVELRTSGNNALSAAQRSALAGQMVAILNQPGDVAEGSDALKYWMKRRAAQVLGALGDPGSSGENAAALRTVIQNKNLPVWLRVDAINAYGRLKFANAGQADAAATTVSIARFVADEAKNDSAFIRDSLKEIEEIANYLDRGAAKGKQNNKKSPGLNLGGGEQALLDDGKGGNADPKTKDGAPDEEADEILPAYKRDLVRRRIKTIIYAAQTALHDSQTDTGLIKQVDAAADAQTAALIQNIVSELESMMETTDVSKKSKRGRSSRDKEDPADGLSMAERLAQALDDGAFKLEKLIQTAAPEPTTPPVAEGKSTGTGD